MRKKTIKYTIVDLGGTRYVVLRLADLDTLITTHHSLSLELIPVLSEAQWERHRQLLYITQHIHVERVSHCKVALLTKTDYDTLNLAISHLHTLLGNIRWPVSPSVRPRPTSLTQLPTNNTIIMYNTNHQQDRGQQAPNVKRPPEAAIISSILRMSSIANRRANNERLIYSHYRRARNH